MAVILSKTAPCEQVRYNYDQEYPCGSQASRVVDPFIAEVCEEIVYRWLCDECSQERWDEI